MTLKLNVSEKGNTIKLSESEIQSTILDWLNRKGIFAFRINTTGTYDEKAGCYRKLGRFSLKGTSDIIGVFKGRILCIEVKSKTGVVSKEQQAFINKINSVGGIAFVARSLDDVINFLQSID